MDSKHSRLCKGPRTQQNGDLTQAPWGAGSSCAQQGDGHSLSPQWTPTLRAGRRTKKQPFSVFRAGVQDNTILWVGSTPWLFSPVRHREHVGRQGEGSGGGALGGRSPGGQPRPQAPGMKKRLCSTNCTWSNFECQ